ncbi:MAG TPA: TlpA disulfide reductase family protein [Dokdonella sp.]|nr:TlpA disulfide reductase family protein [Dokdonella sp.]
MRFAKMATTLVLIALVSMAQAKSLVGTPAPDYLGVDANRKEVRISDQRGKVVVLTFWASWCGYCLKELPILENLQRRVGKENIEVVAINTDKDRDKYRAMRRRMKDFQLTMTVDSDKDGIAGQYGVGGLPHMVLVDKRGRVAFTHIGYAEDQLPRFVYEINQLLEDEPAAQAAATR